MIETCKLRVGNIRKPGKLHYKDGRIYFEFGFWKGLNEEIKNMQGRKYHGYDKVNPKKWWSIPVTPRNMFQLAFLREQNPYKKYDDELKPIELTRSLYKHQSDFASHIVQRKRCIIAGEMGTGKTLAAIEAAEHILLPMLHGTDFQNQVECEKLFWWVGPRSALVAVKYEFTKWQAKVRPRFFTYEGIVKELKNWEDGTKAPRVVIFDESSKIKTPTAKRSQAALALADGVRKDWGDDAVIVEMSGTPAPKSPKDWWHQCEVACPGFLVEGDIFKFQNRIAIVTQKENPITGGAYPALVAWRDDQKRCNICGQYETDDVHLDFTNQDAHAFVPSVNEIAKLYERMKGLVLVTFKKDCLDLPEKRYEIRNIKPNASTLRAAKLIKDTSRSAVMALTRLRELSDGFLYAEEEDGTSTTCNNCHGTGLHSDQVVCMPCNGTGQIANTARVAKEIPCPKVDQLKIDLENHEEVGRIVIYAGFTGSIDRIVRVCRACSWKVIRVDGRGWQTFFDDTDGTLDNLVGIFQDGHHQHPRVAFVGHPGSAGMGLTLTASPTIVYYSNDFSAESRIQSEDRIHRPGMDFNRGATIIDYFHLPTDEYVLDNLRRKRQLQSLSLGEIDKVLNYGTASI